MVAIPKLDETDVSTSIAFMRQLQVLRPQMRAQVDLIRIAAFDTRQVGNRMTAMPNAISPGDFAHLKSRIAELCENTAARLDEMAEMLTALAGKASPSASRDSGKSA